MNNVKKILLIISAAAAMTGSLFAHIIDVDPKVIYGTDDRLPPSIKDSKLIQKLSQSTAAMISWNKMDFSGDSVDLSNNMTLTQDSYFNICSNQRFANEINPANCSGFLIGDDILVTAGHCIRSQSDCDNNAWVFDFTSGNKKLSKKKSVFKCKKILASILNSTDQNDFAVLKLDRSTGREFLPMRTEGKVSKHASLVLVGHPSGLPQKIAGNAGVRVNTIKNYFVANLDTFGGNSGSPVIDIDNEMIEGILVRGEKDYAFDSRQGCNVVYECANTSCRGEDVTRITNISTQLGTILYGKFESDLDENKKDDLDFINDYFFGLVNGSERPYYFGLR